MFSYWQTIGIGYIIVIAAIIGLINFRKIQPEYRPFIYYACVNAINQTINIYMIRETGSNAINANIYVLIEALLLTWLFYNLGAIRKKGILYALIVALIAFWTYENLILSSLKTVNSYFRIFYSFILLFLAISQLNNLIVRSKKNLLLNSSFLISIGIVILYSYKATIETFYLVELNVSNQFYQSVFTIGVLVSLFVYIIYAIAALWIPKKKEFIF